MVMDYHSFSDFLQFKINWPFLTLYALIQSQTGSRPLIYYLVNIQVFMVTEIMTAIHGTSRNLFYHRDLLPFVCRYDLVLTKINGLFSRARPPINESI